MNLGILPIIASLVIEFIVWQVKSGIEGHIAAANAAAEFQYFREVEYKELMPIALELGKQVPIFDYKKWYYHLKQLKDYGLIQSTRPEVQPTIPPVVAPPKGDEKEGKESDYSQYLIWAAVGLFILVIAKR